MISEVFRSVRKQTKKLVGQLANGAEDEEKIVKESNNKKQLSFKNKISPQFNDHEEPQSRTHPSLACFPSCFKSNDKNEDQEAFLNQDTSDNLDVPEITRKCSKRLASIYPTCDDDEQKSKKPKLLNKRDQIVRPKETQPKKKLFTKGPAVTPRLNLTRQRNANVKKYPASEFLKGF
ncbi:unnamed protein product, partial [Mesorhabditis belari]|uniref:Uncharacterized protein n=1 Tax=Mesorhabditis belari TaxID=2138241 RepID=A0AAF3E9H5_9BILA